MRLCNGARLLRGASRGALATLMIALPAAARAQAYQGTPTVSFGSATIDRSVAGTDTITLPTSSPVTTINWVPTDSATGGGPIDFLPNGNTANYVGASGASGPYTVLNRILPADSTRAAAFNGQVTSTPDVRVWFYSPGGLLIGSTAQFNVGGLVLTAADPTTDLAGSFMPTFDQFSVAAAGGSTSAIVVQAGAQLRAENLAQANYIVLVAPKIDQGGTISTRGSVALVAAEAATFAVDSMGLFNITVDAGTSVSTDTFVHTGSTGGPDSFTAALGAAARRVYMVAVPKNNAISMAIQSGGSIGFDIADAASLDGNTIVLSAGHNIQDTGSGNPIVAGPAGTGSADISVARGSFTSNTYIGATGSATVTDTVAGGTPDISFASNLTMVAPVATLTAAQGAVSVGGDLLVSADADTYNPAGTAYAGVAGAGTSLTVGGSTTVSASAPYQASPFAEGGTATLESQGGSITSGGSVKALADGREQVPTVTGPVTEAHGGTALITASGGGTIEATGFGQILASAIAYSSTSIGSAQVSGTNLAINALGGDARVIATGSGSSITSPTEMTATAQAIGGGDPTTHAGGSATGGVAVIEADNGALINSGGGFIVDGGASGGYATGGNGDGGQAIGGFAQLVANDASIAVTADGVLDISARALGGSTFADGVGGAASGGLAKIETLGTSGQISNLFGTGEGAIFLSADAFGGYVSGNGSGGNATGGTASLMTTGAGQSIAVSGGSITASADAYAGGGGLTDSNGGDAHAGAVNVSAVGGQIDLQSDLYVSTSAQGGSSGCCSSGIGVGGGAWGGKITLGALDGGSTTVAGYVDLAAAASGGTSNSGPGGYAEGGFIKIGADAATLSLDTIQNGTSLNATAFGGADAGSGGPFTPGNVLFTSTNGALVESGAAGTTADNLLIGDDVAISGNSQVRMAADGNVAVTGTVSGSGDLARLELRADQQGTGIGTVTLANNALSLSGAGATIGIYYNPASFGTSFDYSPGVAAGAWLGYQLVNTLGKLQAIGSYLDQNFALSRDIDASATLGWNAGAGFVPIGTSATPFTGNFDGLEQTIGNLYINLPGQSDVGLFGAVSASTAPISIRRVGVENANITGDTNVGGLIGSLPNCSCNGITLSDLFATGTVTGNDSVGGLIGSIGQTAQINDVHADGSVNALGSTNAGGLIGNAGSASIVRAFFDGTLGTAAGFANVGGLVGQLSAGSISESYASGTMTVGTGNSFVGGLVGINTGTINLSYAVNDLTAGSGSDAIGGLVGQSSGAIDEAYASGLVSAAGSTNVGGLAGINSAAITNSYWDSYSTGQGAGTGANTGSTATLLEVTSDPGQSGALNYALGPYAYTNFSTNWIYVNDLTRPIGLWEIPKSLSFSDQSWLYSAHQVELIGENLSGAYRIGHDIDMSGTGRIGDVWIDMGFIPIGGNTSYLPLNALDPYGDLSFTGSLEGHGKVLFNLLTYQPGQNSGLFAINDGTISDLGLVNADIEGGPVTDGYGAGALAGINNGAITGSFATGLVGWANGEPLVGGLAGINTGTITNSYASVTVVPTLGGAGIPSGTGGGGGGQIIHNTTGGSGSGGTGAGGLVGSNYGTIAFSFANGAVMPDTSGYATEGGIVGKSQTDGTTYSGTINDSYWDTQLSGQTVACGSGPCIIGGGLTTAQTMQASSFPTWSIDASGGQPTTWRIYEGLTTPLLKAFMRTVTVQATDQTLPYSGAVPDLALDLLWGYPDKVFGTPSFSGLSANAGTWNVLYAGGLYSDQLGYDLVASAVAAQIVITPVSLTLSAVSDSRAYDATTGSAASVMVTGLQGTDTVSNLSQSFDSANVGSRTLAVDSGFSVNDGNSGGNYTVSLVTATGTITPALLTLAAVSDSRAYDTTTDSAAAVTITGLQGTDTVSNLSQSFDSADAGSRTLAVNSGFTVNDGNSGDNYTVSLVTAAGTITSAALVVTYTADPASSVYGDAPPALNGSVSAEGLVAGDALADVLGGSASFTTQATGLSGVGDYAITGSGLSGASGNYTYSFVQAPGNDTALTITARPLSVVADPQSRDFGTENPPLTYVATGLVNGDQLTGSLATDAGLTSPIGSYDITQGSLASSPDYQLTYTGNQLEVTASQDSLDHVVNMIEPNIIGQEKHDPAPSDPEEKQKKNAEDAIAHSTNPNVLISTVVDSGNVEQADPVDEPVTSNGVVSK